jgi:hypothetical protein
MIFKVRENLAIDRFEETADRGEGGGGVKEVRLEGRVIHP